MERRLQLLARMHDSSDEKRYVLVIKNRGLALGPFGSIDEAEYAAMDHYGTAITGASANGEFLIAELRPVDPEAVARQREAHVRGLLLYDD